MLKIAYGSTFLSITKKDLSNLNIKIPTLAEQEKISFFLLNIDNKIDFLNKQLSEIINFKKYLMQNILSQKLRFDGFEDEWKEVKLSDISERITRKNKDLETELPLTISAQYGLVDQETFFNKVVASKSLKGYYLIKNGEFAYNKSYSNGYPWGAIKRLDNYSIGALSTLYICFKPKNVDSDFLTHYFESTRWYHEISKIAVEGARNHGLLNVAVGDFFNTKHLIPSSIEEQKTIASFLNSVDKKLDFIQNQLSHMEQFKKGLLQQMFV